VAKLDLSLTDDELHDYLEEQRTVRLATASSDGRPHVIPLWFVWVDETIFLNTTLGNLTVEQFMRNPRVAAVVDDGPSYEELRGVVVHGLIERADEDERLPEVRRRWSDKYMDGGPVPYDRWRNRVWLRLRPDRVTSWDFRKIPEAKARAAGAR
jgi:nitroimidazol reductase NimA-like FMN-containing flavoprotein (pyridoxamine 5'-phosphate oxidase superfamily)